MFATALALVMFTAAPVPKGAEKPPPTIQGEWKVVEYLHNGKFGGTAGQNATFIFKDVKLAIHKRERPEIVTYKLDPTATPATIDFVSEKAPTEVVRGIYKLENDKLTICFPRGQGDRPTKFESPEKGDITLFVLERVKK